MLFGTFFLGINHRNTNHTYSFNFKRPVNISKRKLMESWRPSWIYSFPGAKCHEWPQKWIIWPKFSNSRGITHDYNPKTNNFVKSAVFKMAANAILNISNPSTITLGYRLENCSLGPILQESTLKKTLTIFFGYPLGSPWLLH